MANKKSNKFQSFVTACIIVILGFITYDLYMVHQQMTAFGDSLVILSSVLSYIWNTFASSQGMSL